MHGRGRGVRRRGTVRLYRIATAAVSATFHTRVDLQQQKAPSDQEWRDEHYGQTTSAADGIGRAEAGHTRDARGTQMAALDLAVIGDVENRHNGADGDRDRAVQYLHPRQRKEGHRDKAEQDPIVEPNGGQLAQSGGGAHGRTAVGMELLRAVLYETLSAGETNIRDDRTIE